MFCIYMLHSKLLHCASNEALANVVFISQPSKTNKIKLPRFGFVKFAKSREVEDRILKVTMRRHPSDKYVVSILVETEIIKHFL